MIKKINSYLNLIPKGLKTPLKIIEGISNEIKSEFNLLTEEEQNEILRRRLICQSCPFYSLNVINNDLEYQKLYNKKFDDKREGKFCGICGCPESIRTSSLSADCGLDDYNKENPNNIQELKWTKYK